MDSQDAQYHSRGPFSPEDGPAMARERVVLANLRHPDDRLPALCNPQEFRRSVSISVGRLNPIGSSHPVKNYSHTNDWQIPLDLYFSQFILWLKGYKYPTIKQAVEWLMCFTVPRERGAAPYPLLLIWPNWSTDAVTIDGMDIGAERFDKDLNCRVATVSLKMSEILDRGDIVTYGTYAPLRGKILSEWSAAGNAAGASPYGSKPTGSPLNLASGPVRRNKR